MAQLSPDELKDKFWKMLANDPVVIMGLTSVDHHSVPMRTQLDKDARGEIWFFTGRDHPLAQGGRAKAAFTSDGHKLYASLRGTISEERNTAVIDKHWNNAVAAWYAKGREDPNMIMLRFDIDDAEFWTADITVKGLFHMLTGTNIKPADIGSHAEVAL